MRKSELDQLIEHKLALLQKIVDANDEEANEDHMDEYHSIYREAQQCLNDEEYLILLRTK